MEAKDDSESIDTDTPQMAGPCCHIDCFGGCGAEIPVAIWDDSLLSGELQPFCRDCSQDVPEYNLYEKPGEVPEGKEYIVRDRHENWVEDRIETFDKTGEVKTIEELQEALNEEDTPVSFDHITEKPSPTPEIVMRDASDEEALEEARQEVIDQFPEDCLYD